MKGLRLYVLMASFFILAISISALELYRYDKVVNDNLSQATSTSIEEILIQQRSNLIIDIGADMDMLVNIAKVISRPSVSQEEAFQLIRDLTNSTNYDNIFLLALPGVDIFKKRE